VSDAGEVFGALADPRRRELVAQLGDRVTATATELARELPVTRQAVQKHLAALSEAGLVASTREGREVRYRLTPAPMTEAVAWMSLVGGQWDERLRALRDQVPGARTPPPA
jgi:DNA-binding transcriptional ArsR family regulator